MLRPQLLNLTLVFSAALGVLRCSSLRHECKHKVKSLKNEKRLGARPRRKHLLKKAALHAGAVARPPRPVCVREQRAHAHTCAFDCSSSKTSRSILIFSMDCVAEVRFISCCLSRRAKRSWAILSCRISYKKRREDVHITVDESSTCPKLDTTEGNRAAYARPRTCVSLAWRLSSCWRCATRPSLRLSTSLQGKIKGGHDFKFTNEKPWTGMSCCSPLTWCVL